MKITKISLSIRLDREEFGQNENIYHEIESMGNLLEHSSIDEIIDIQARCLKEWVKEQV